MSEITSCPPQIEEPEPILATSAMHERYGGLARLLFGAVFGPVSYPAECAERIDALSRRGVLIYVARTPSTSTALQLNFALSRLGLPLARFVSGTRLVLWQPVDRLWRILRQRVRDATPSWGSRLGAAARSGDQALLADTVLRGEAALLFLRDRRGELWPSSSAADCLRSVVSAQRLSQRSFFLVPHAVTGRMLGGATRRRAMPQLAGRARVAAGEAIDLKSWIERLSDDDEVLARRLGRELDRRISAEERVVAGPELSSPDAIKRRVLRDPAVMRVLRDEAARTGTGFKAAEASAAAHLDEISARYSPRITSLFATIMNAVFDRIYDGIVVDETGLARAIEASRRSALVFCPSHKSHVDYLVLSLVLWNHGVTPPHIAAGANLSFFPLGSLLRRSGAFFLRRSFREDPIYSAVLRAYVVELVRHGTALEFFVEGTRSRTGKVLMPRLGLLSFAVDAWRRGAADDIQFVPVSVDYERILESASHERELMGAEKSPEGMAALLRQASVLRSRYGRVYLQFGEPVSLAALAREKGLPAGSDPEHDEAWRGEVERLGYRVLHRVTTIGTVTSAAVAATALLAESETCIQESSLLLRGREILGYLDCVAARLSAPLADPTARDHALLEAVHRFVREGEVATDRPQRRDSEPVYRVAAERRMALDLYKNTLMNHLAGAAIVCRALRRSADQAARRDVHRDAGFLFQLFAREFFRCADWSIETCIDDELSRLALQGYLDVHGDGRIAAREPTRTWLLAGLLDAFVQGYWVVASTLAELRCRPFTRADLIDRAMERARSGLRDGRITSPECANRTLVRNAAEWMIVNRVVEPQATGEEKTFRLGPEHLVGGLERLIQEIRAFF